MAEHCPCPQSLQRRESPDLVGKLHSDGLRHCAIMSVPAHDERTTSCQKIQNRDSPGDPAQTPIRRKRGRTQASVHHHTGQLVNSGRFTHGLPKPRSRPCPSMLEKSVFGEATVTYRLKGLGASRSGTGARLSRLLYCAEGCIVARVGERSARDPAENVEFT